MERLKLRLLDFLILFILWMLLVWSLDIEGVVAGAILALFFSFIVSGLLPEGSARFFSPRRWFWALVHLAVLSYYIVLANLDVLYRVLHPNLPIRPGIVKVKTTLQSDEAKAFLANSITLTPGTLSVDIIGDTLYVHWICVYENLDDVEKITWDIAGKFEATLRRVFD